VFWGQPQAIFVGAISGNGADSAANRALRLAGNVFWTNTVNLFVPPEQGQPTGAPPAVSSRTIADFPGNQEADPGYADAPGGNFSQDARWAGELGQVGAPAPLSLASPWPLQPEERAIIPEGATRDSRGWKRPRTP